jgi:hypothetical protein
MANNGMNMALDAVAEALVDQSAQRADVETPFENAIEQALSVPFSVLDGAFEPLTAQGEINGKWEWAVFLNTAPGKTERATMRSLCRKLSAARQFDEEESYFEGRFLTSFDLTKRSGNWPHSSIHAEPAYDGFASSAVRHRFVLCSENEAVGFCTTTVTVTYYCDGDPPQAELEIGSVFVDPECRELGLSHLLAEAAASVMIIVLREFHLRLIAAQSQSCDLEVSVTGEPISPGGERFLDAVAKQLKQQCRRSFRKMSTKQGLRITKISVLHE